MTNKSAVLQVLPASADEISQRLGIKRASVTNIITALRKSGYKIVAAGGRDSKWRYELERKSTAS